MWTSHSVSEEAAAPLQLGVTEGMEDLCHSKRHFLMPPAWRPHALIASTWFLELAAINMEAADSCSFN